MKIAFVGNAGVGKDTLSTYVAEKYNLVHISSGDLVRNYVTENNLGTTERKNLHVVANDLRRRYGGDFLVKMALEKQPDNVIVSGLRAVEEISSFKKAGGVVVAIKASQEQRFKFAKERNREEEDRTFEKWKAIDDEEEKNFDPQKQNVLAVINSADYTLLNDGPIEDLFKKCDELVATIKFN